MNLQQGPVLALEGAPFDVRAGDKLRQPGYEANEQSHQRHEAYTGANFPGFRV